jgi:ATP-dependent exoDNAse (exonuclease V) beta subunit
VHSWSANLDHPVPPDVDPGAVEIVSLIGDAAFRSARPRGPAFGALVHALLARAPLDGRQDALAAVATAEARVLGLDDLDRGAAVQVVSEVMAQPLFDRVRAAAASGRAVQREVAITYMLPDGRLLEGVVDLAFDEGEQWTVVDYKTDQELAATGEERYRRQVAVYAAAVQAAMRQPAEALLVRL